MNPQAKQIDEAGIIARLKKSGDKETLRYIEALKRLLINQQELTGKAIGKLQEIVREEKQKKSNDRR